MRLWNLSAEEEEDGRGVHASCSCKPGLLELTDILPRYGHQKESWLIEPKNMESDLIEEEREEWMHAMKNNKRGK